MTHVTGNSDGARRPYLLCLCVDGSTRGPALSSCNQRAARGHDAELPSPSSPLLAGCYDRNRARLSVDKRRLCSDDSPVLTTNPCPLFPAANPVPFHTVNPPPPLQSLHLTASVRPFRSTLYPTYGIPSTSRLSPHIPRHSARHQPSRPRGNLHCSSLGSVFDRPELGPLGELG